MIPARKHFKTAKTASGQINLLLKIGNKFTARNANTHSRFNFITRLKIMFHRCIEPRKAITALMFCFIHRDVGATRERINCLTVGGAMGNPD